MRTNYKHLKYLLLIEIKIPFLINLSHDILCLHRKKNNLKITFLVLGKIMIKVIKNIEPRLLNIRREPTLGLHNL